MSLLVLMMVSKSEATGADQEAARIFRGALRNEFIGHGVKAYFDQEPYYIGLVYQLGVYADYFETPLVATILSKRLEPFRLVWRDEIVSEYLWWL